MGRKDSSAGTNLARGSEIKEITGEAVECGILNGGTAAVLAHFATRSPLGHTVWLFDSFEGMRQPTEEDGETVQTFVGQVVGNIESVLRVFQRVDADLKRVRIVKGWFHNTFLAVNIERIAYASY